LAPTFILAMPARTLPAVDLQTAVPRIFDQVQTSAANHQKNFVALHKLHLEAAKRTANLAGEREFETVFFTLLARVLPIKKGATTADRVVKFVGGYTKFVNERGKSFMAWLPFLSLIFKQLRMKGKMRAMMAISIPIPPPQDSPRNFSNSC
jgi:hypothetical protein